MDNRNDGKYGKENHIINKNQSPDDKYTFIRDERGSGHVKVLKNVYRQNSDIPSNDLPPIINPKIPTEYHNFDDIDRKFCKTPIDYQKHTLIVKPTIACNLSCPYCYEKEHRKPLNAPGNKMTMETVKKIISVFEGKVSSWIWHGGEPLMMGYDFYDEANALIRESLGNEIRINMQTNATLIDEKMIAMFAKYNLNPGLSFDGINNSITRGSTGKIINAVNLLEKYNRTRSTIMVLDDKSMKNVIDEYEYCKRLNIKSDMNTIFKSVLNGEAYDINDDLLVKHTCEFFEYWIRDLNDPMNSRLIKMYIDAIMEDGHMTCTISNCIGGWFGILPDGSITQCGREWGTDVIFGNIHDMNSPEDILQHPNHKRIKGLVSNFFDNCYESKCKFFYACHGDCLAHAYSFDKSLETRNENQCSSRRAIMTYIMKRLNEIDIEEYPNLNPYFVRMLFKHGFRNINFMKKVINIMEKS